MEEPTVDARHLRRLLDIQPSCLMRVASTGEILAANDAALELLGAEQRKHALGVPFTRWTAPDERASWDSFVSRIVGGASASFETMLMRGQVRRKILVHGLPLMDHPDGIPSLLLAVHDISERMALEATIEALRRDAPRPATPSDEIGEEEVPLDEPEAEAESLQARFEQLTAEHASALAVSVQAEEAHLQRQRELEARIDELVAERQSAQTAAAEAVEVQQRLQRDFDERLERVRTEHQASQAAASETGTVYRLREQLKTQHATLEALDADRLTAVKQLAGARAGRFQAEARFQALVREHEAQTQAQAAEATAECRRLAAELHEARTRHEQLTADLHETEARHDQLAVELQNEAQARHEHLVAEVGSGELALQASQAATQALQSALEARDAEVARVTTERAAAVAQTAEATALWFQLDSQLRDVELRREELAVEVQLRRRPDDLTEQVMAALEAREAELAQVMAARTAEAAQLTEMAAARRRLDDELDEAQARHEQLEATLHEAQTRHAQHTTETAARHEQLAAELQHEAQMRHEELAAEVSSAQLALRASQAATQELQAALEARQVELTQVTAARGAVVAQLGEMAVERRRLEGEFSAAAALHEQRGTELHQAKARRDQLAAAHQAVEARLTEATAAQRRVEAELDEARARQEPLAAAMSDALAAKQGLQAALKAHQVELVQVSTAGAAAVTQLEKVTAERVRLHQTVELLGGQHRAELARELADQHRLQVLLDLAAQQHQDLRARLGSAEQDCRERQARVDETTEAYRLLQTRVQAVEADRLSAAVAHAAERERLEQLVGTAESEREMQVQAAANREVVVSTLAEHLRRLAPLVSTGRLTRDVAPQLQEHVERADGLASRVLSECGLHGQGRSELESLRAEVVRAGALASELVRAGELADAASTTVERRGSRGVGHP